MSAEDGASSASQTPVRPRKGLTARPAPTQPRRTGPAVVSIVLHGLLIVALAQVLIVPHALRTWFANSKVRESTRERITFIAPRSEPAAGGATTTSPVTAAPRAPGRPAPPLVAPTEVPAGIPPVPAQPAGRTGEAEIVGPLAGGTGPSRGMKPSYTDPRVWSMPANVASVPKSSTERLDSAVSSMVTRFNDSLRTTTYEPNKFERGDWTVEKDGKKYGIDDRYIRLGKISLPLPLLALLPIHTQPNPIAYEREKQLAAMRADIVEHAQSAMNEEEFRRAVRNLRERKERERKEREKKGETKVIAPEGQSGRRPL